MTQNRFVWVGVALIILGVTLLARRLGYLALSWRDIVWGILALYGGVKVVNGFFEHETGKAFWGAGLLLLGILSLVHPLNVRQLEPLSVVSAFLLILGVSFIIAFLSNTRQWHLVIPALFFFGLGAISVAADYGYLYWGDVADHVENYWSVALVLFGVSLLLNRRSA